MNVAHDTTSKTLFGFWAFLMSDLILFASLFATYIVLRENTYGGPTASHLLHLPLPLAQTLILLTSSFACGPAVLAAYHKKKGKTIAWLAIAFLLGIAFIALEGMEFARLVQGGNSWERSAFLSAFFNLIGTHGAHILVGLLWMVFLVVQMMRLGITSVAIKRLTCLRLFWHFLNIVWIFIFTFVYLIREGAYA